MVHGTEIYIVISGSIFELPQCIQPLRIAGADSLLLHCYVERMICGNIDFRLFNVFFNCTVYFVMYMLPRQWAFRFQITGKQCAMTYYIRILVINGSQECKKLQLFCVIIMLSWWLSHRIQGQLRLQRAETEINSHVSDFPKLLRFFDSLMLIWLRHTLLLLW